MSNEKQINCCNNSDIVSDNKIVVFTVEDVTHNAKKWIHFKLKWCANCEKIKTLDCTEVIK